MTTDTQKTETAGADTTAAAAAAGGAADAGAAAKDAGAAAPKDGTDAGAAPAAIYKPEGLPDHLAGKTDQETIDLLFKSWGGFRKDAAKKGIPETPDGYELSLPDDLKDKVLHLNKDGKDVVFEAIKPIAHKHGMPSAAVSAFAAEAYRVLVDMGGGAGTDNAGPAADFDFKSLGGAEKAAPHIEGATVWINGLQQTGKISEKVAGELKLLTSYGEGVEVLSALRGLTGEAPIPSRTDGDTPQEVTKEILQERVADPRYKDKGSEYYRETTKMFEKLYSQKNAS